MTSDGAGSLRAFLSFRGLGRAFLQKAILTLFHIIFFSFPIVLDKTIAQYLEKIVLRSALLCVHSFFLFFL